MVCVILPALNEEKTIGNVLESVRNYVDEIIVIDDGSKDNTSKISKKYAFVITHSKNQGYDKSLNEGFKLAKKRNGDIIITFDADGQHLAEDIPKLIEPILNKESDVVVGKRINKPRIGEFLFANHSKKNGVSDPVCGMKAYHKIVYEDAGFFTRQRRVLFP